MWITKTNLLIYCSHFLSCWGNRMWMFGMGMFLVRIADDSIQLSATYGLATGLAIFFLGALVGDWVDNTPRLKAAQLSLVLQDALMLGCASVVTAYLWFHDDIRASNTWLSPFLKGVIILLGVFSNLASQARIIAVERDWIVEICGQDSDHLATMTATMRRIDQISMILAPMATGQVMTYVGLVFGAIFIGSWNVLSVFVEFFLMYKVYDTVPALKAKKHARRTDDDEHDFKIPLNEQTTAAGNSALPPPTTTPPPITTTANNATTTSSSSTTTTPALTSTTDFVPASNATGGTQQQLQPVACSLARPASDGAFLQDACKGPDAVSQGKASLRSSVGRGTAMLARSRMLYQCVTLYRGWRTYARYSVALSGLALAFLYMTVLGFDNITVAYAVTQGLTESVLGILMGSSAVFGILGTFAYPVIRRRVGLVRTGFVALSCQVSCLTLCVLSVWMPGSPFDPLYRNVRLSGCATSSDGQPRNASSPVLLISADPRAAVMMMNATVPPSSLSNNSVISLDITSNSCDDTLGKWAPDSHLSVIFLMAGIFLSRFAGIVEREGLILTESYSKLAWLGVWIADLTITQLFLEKVVPGERGIVNGVQSSLNQLMDLLKFALVVAIPDTQTFGFLVVISFSFIFAAWCLYGVFVRRERVPLCVCCDGGSSRSGGGWSVRDEARGDYSETCHLPGKEKNVLRDHEFI